MNNGERRGRGTGWVTEQSHKTMFTNHSLKKKKEKKRPEVESNPRLSAKFSPSLTP